MNKTAAMLVTMVMALLSFPSFSQDNAERTPHCTTPRQCEIMWSDAQKALGVISNMRIRLITDSRIETYGPIGITRVGATITKEPAGESGYDIRLQLECYRNSYCGDLQSSGTRLFNTLMNSNPSAREGAPPEPSESSSSGTSPISQQPSLHDTRSTSPAPQQTRIAPQPFKDGQGKYQAEQFAQTHACTLPVTAGPAGPGFETYSAACSNGDTMMIRCEFGNCRALK